MVRRILPEEVDLHQRTAPVAGALGRFNKFAAGYIQVKLLGYMMHVRFSGGKI